MNKSRSPGGLHNSVIVLLFHPKLRRKGVSINAKGCITHTHTALLSVRVLEQLYFNSTVLTDIDFRSPGCKQAPGILAPGGHDTPGSSVPMWASQRHRCIHPWRCKHHPNSAAPVGVR